MAPAEVHEATTSHHNEIQDYTRDRWYLCGDVAESMFAALLKHGGIDRPSTFTVFSYPGGNTYGVLGHQVEDKAHLFVLPLYERKIRRFLEAQHESGFGVSFGRNDEGQALITNASIPQDAVASALELADLHDHRDGNSLKKEIPLVLQTIATPDNVILLSPNAEVHSASISFILPIESMERPAARSTGSYGRWQH